MKWIRTSSVARYVCIANRAEGWREILPLIKLANFIRVTVAKTCYCHVHFLVHGANATWGSVCMHTLASSLVLENAYIYIYILLANTRIRVRLVGCIILLIISIHTCSSVHTQHNMHTTSCSCTIHNIMHNTTTVILRACISWLAAVLATTS